MAGEEGFLTQLLLFSWLGRRDLNPRMPVPKTGALPLGDSPLKGQEKKSNLLIIRDLSHLRRPRNFAKGNTLPSEDFLANCHRQFSP